MHVSCQSNELNLHRKTLVFKILSKLQCLSVAQLCNEIAQLIGQEAGLKRSLINETRDFDHHANAAIEQPAKCRNPCLTGNE